MDYVSSNLVLCRDAFADVVRERVFLRPLPEVDGRERGALARGRERAEFNRRNVAAVREVGVVGSFRRPVVREGYLGGVRWAFAAVTGVHDVREASRLEEQATVR